MTDKQSWEAISVEDAQRWAEHFAAASFGDSVFASSLALLLQVHVPAALQVGLGVESTYLDCTACCLCMKQE